jgi:hypothetical protein
MSTRPRKELGPGFILRYPKSAKEDTRTPFQPSTRDMLLPSSSDVNLFLRRVSDMHETSEDKLAAILDEAAAGRGACEEA